MDRGVWPDGVEHRNNKRVMVTGSAGFLGSFIVEKLQARGTVEVFVPHIEEYAPSALLPTPDGRGLRRTGLRDLAAIRGDLEEEDRNEC